MCTSKISVWWDIENCPVPRNVDPHRVAQNVSSTLNHANFKGPVTIDVFGDTKHLEQRTLEALSSTGVTINHVPSGNKDAADKAILVAMLFWALDNPPPAHFVLISGDGDFANALHRLRMKRYNVLIARPDQPVKPALLGAATSVWYWRSVAMGQLSATDGLGKMEETLRKSPTDSSTKEQSAYRSFHQQRSRSIPSERSNGFTLPPSAASNRIHCQDGQAQKLYKGSLSCSLPHNFESTAELSSLQVNSLSTTDSITNLKHLHSADERRRAPKLWGQESELVKDNANCNPLHQSSFSKSGMTKAQLNSEFNTDASCSSHTPFSGQQYLPPVFMNKQFDDPTGMRPFFPEMLHPVLSRPSCDALQRSFKPSDTNPHSVWKSGPIFNSMATDLPSSAPEPANLAEDKLDSYRSSLNKVIKALETLKQDGLMPTEANLRDCLACCDTQHEKFNLKQILDKAVERQEITLISERPGGFWMFLPLNTKLWACVNTTDMLHEFSRDVWLDFCRFLCCTESRWLFLKSQSKYEAARCLKINGPIQLQRLSIAQIIHVLHQSIQNKNWLRLHGTEWVPLSINVHAMIEYSANQPNHNTVGSKTGICCNEEKPLTEVSPHNQSTTVSLPTNSSRKLMIFQKLRVWLVKTLIMKADYDMSLVRKDFEQATGIHLDHTEFGYPRFQDLIREFSDVVQIKELRKGFQALYPVIQKADCKPVSFLNKFVDMGTSTKNTADLIVGKLPHSTSNQASGGLQPAAKQRAILKTLKKWLIQLPKLKNGYDISLIRKDFQHETGIFLDLQSLGYVKIKDLIDEFSDDLHLENPRKGLFLLFPNKMEDAAQASQHNKMEDAAQASQHAKVETGVKWIPTHETNGIHVSEQGRSEYTANSGSASKQGWESHSKACPPLMIETVPRNLLEFFPPVNRAAGVAQMSTLTAVGMHGLGEDTIVAAAANIEGTEFFPAVNKAAGVAQMPTLMTVGIHGSGENGIEAAANIEGTAELVVVSLSQPPVSTEAHVQQGTARQIADIVRTERKGCGETVNSESIKKPLLEHLSKTFSPVDVGSTILQTTVYRDIDICKSEQEGSEKLNISGSTLKEVSERLRSWLGLVMVDVQDGYDITNMHGDFLAASGIDLNTINFGLDKLKNFLLESSDITWLDSSRTGLCLAFPAKRTAIGSPKCSAKMLKDTEILLLEVVPNFKEGYPMARLKLDFHHHFGYELDQSSAGFSRLGDYLRSFKFVRIESAPGGPQKVLYLTE